MGTRRNVMIESERRAFAQACVALDTEMSGVTAADAAGVLSGAVPGLRMAGQDQELSYYDLFVLWHVAAMSLPRGLPGQNAAHSGPVFLPWHRHFMILLERWMQIVLGDDDYGLPYWDWAADGDLPESQQIRTALWSPGGIGQARGEVTEGIVADMQVRLWQDPLTGILWSRSPRRLRRAAGQEPDPAFRTLPTTASVRAALGEADYDAPPWTAATAAFRGRIEGWAPSEPGRRVDLHNLVHVWVGGDMGPGSSPNDPVFFLNHCNVDRIWEGWMERHGESYRPEPDQGPPGHDLDDAMFTLLGESRAPRDVLDAAPWYEYDALPD